tara:strand:+ start:1408 stop:2220 length:813 start_codon:yes stop_codon:yes gene_type:complete
VTTLQLVVIAIVQGITEFLPISSSAHLRLIPEITGWPDQGLTIDIATHVGTLSAVLVYFWRDVWSMAQGLLDIVRGRRSPATALLIYLVLATVPIVIVGALLLAGGYEDGNLTWLRHLDVIGWTMLVFGLFLFLADRMGMTVRRIEHITPVSALIIGCAQILALVPGTSRTGITVTAARMLGFERADAARFAVLLGVPAIVASAVPSGVALYNLGDATLGFEALLAALLAFAVALAAIAAMMQWLKRAGFTPFVVYRLLLGIAILVWVYT